MRLTCSGGPPNIAVITRSGVRIATKRLFASHLHCCILRKLYGLGVLLKHFRPALLLLAVALFSASAWADGIDPKVIIQKGTGSIPITGQNPNPSFPVPGQPPLIASVGSFNDHGTSRPCLSEIDACVSIVFQNQTSQTLHNLTIAINDLADFSFECGDVSQISFFSSCSESDDGHVTDVTFSGGTGILPAVQSCVSPTAVSV